MSKHKLQFFEITGIAAGVPLHDGTTGQGWPDQVPAFTLQAAGGDVLISDENQVGSDIGLTLTDGGIIGWGNLESRGTDTNFDLKSIYVKGAGSVILAIETPA
jgi:hypothetical protein